MRVLFGIIFTLVITTFDFSNVDSLMKMVLPVLLVMPVFFGFKNFLKAKNAITTNGKNYLYFGLVFIFILSFLRTNNYMVSDYYGVLKSLKFILYVACCMIFYFSYFNKGLLIFDDKFYFRIIIIPSLFIFISTILYLTGADPFYNNLNDFSVGKSVLASTFFKSEIERKGSPLSVGINGYGVYVGAILTMSLTALFTMKSKKYRFFSILLVLICLFNFIYVDTRSALIWSVFAAFISLILIVSRRILFSKILIVLFSTIMPFVLIGASFLLRSEVFNVLSRSDNDIETGNNRLYIWISSWIELKEMKKEHIFGYGEYGQKAAGVSKDFDKIFSQSQNYDLLTTHNIVFQTILDSGYVGLVLLFLLVFLILNMINSLYRRHQDKNLAIFLAFILYFFLVGGAEANLTHRLSFHLFWFILTGLLFFRVFYTKKTELESQTNLLNQSNDL